MNIVKLDARLGDIIEDTSIGGAGIFKVTKIEITDNYIMYSGDPIREQGRSIIPYVVNKNYNITWSIYEPKTEEEKLTKKINIQLDILSDFMNNYTSSNYIYILGVFNRCLKSIKDLNKQMKELGCSLSNINVDETIIKAEGYFEMMKKYVGGKNGE